MILINTPKFFATKNWISTLLLPLSWIYYIMTRIIYNISKPEKLEGKTVICMGNITVGGAGKTPSCILMFQMLGNNDNICFLSRGYGRKINQKNGLTVVQESDNYLDVGDEPLLLSRYAKTYVFNKTSDIFKNIDMIKEGIIIMDDGLQNHKIFKDHSILVVDGDFKFGNNRLLPAGPLRESYKSITNRIDYIIQVGGEQIMSEHETHNKHVIHTKVIPVLDNIDLTKKYIAFSGLARNEKFFNTLLKYNILVEKTFLYPDHYRYKQSDLNKMLKHNLSLITTEKDYMRLKHFQEAKNIIVLPISLDII